MNNLKALTAIVACAILAGCATGASNPGSTAGLYTFGLIGDLAYRPENEPNMQNVLDELNATTLEFVAHVGDLGAPRYGSCSNALWARRKAQFDASANPNVFSFRQRIVAANVVKRP